MEMTNLLLGIVIIILAIKPSQEKVERYLNQPSTHSTGSQDEAEVEKYVSYWREDIGLNFFHWRWHSVFPAYWKSKNGEKRDRVGELFPYMHEQILARYDAERLSAGVQRVDGLHHWKGSSIIPGYNASDFTKGISGKQYYFRPTNMMLKEMNPTNYNHMLHCYKIIVHDIKKGYLKMMNGTKVLLQHYSDIEILGGVLLGSALRHIFPRYCEFHGEGHFAFSHLHNIWDSDEDNSGPIAFPRSSMRDPLFFSWHKLLEDIFWEFKKRLQPYKVEQLQWISVQVVNISVQGGSTHKTNELLTFWQKRNVTLNRGLDFGLRHPVKVRLGHLQHEPFEYRLLIQNHESKSLNSVVRIYLAPQKDEKGQAYNVAEQCRLFIEMDKFVAYLTPGTNTILRHSDNSTITNDAFSRIAELTLFDGSDTSTEDDDLVTYCSCGFPNHLLLPRGKPKGMDFLLFAIVTNADNDIKATTYPDCHAAPGYCGIMNDVYPDSRPMGFPFDRPVVKTSIEKFKTANMAYTNVVITFNNVTVEI